MYAQFLPLRDQRLPAWATWRDRLCIPDRQCTCLVSGIKYLFHFSLGRNGLPLVGVINLCSTSWTETGVMSRHPFLSNHMYLSRIVQHGIYPSQEVSGQDSVSLSHTFADLVDFVVLSFLWVHAMEYAAKPRRKASKWPLVEPQKTAWTSGFRGFARYYLSAQYIQIYRGFLVANG